LASASGLKPMSAFVVVAAVVVAVVVQVGRLSLVAGRESSHPTRVERGERPSYRIDDRIGRPLARFVSQLDLELSPRSMWRAHTPDLMARELSAALGGVPDARTLLAAMLPGAEDGVIRVEDWDLTPREADAVVGWIHAGGRHVAGAGGESLPGVWLEQTEDPLVWHVAWDPAVLLSSETRKAHGFTGPMTWTRFLADGLVIALPERLGVAADDLERRGVRGNRVDLCRDAVWRAWFPRAWCRPVEDLRPEYEGELAHVLAEQGVADHQLRVVRTRRREYPMGSFELLGDWGYVDPEATEPAPRGGLEALGDRTFGRLLELGIVPEPSVYAYRRQRPVGRTRVKRDYYVGSADADGAPTIGVTLDIELQRLVRRELLGVLDRHEPVLAMAIAIDVPTGEVLALDSVHAYELAGFAPTTYCFTPGSTLKVITMASALDAGTVSVHEKFDVGTGPYVVPGSRRKVFEAEGTVHGELSPAECIAFSSNRGMVQVGLTMSAEVFDGYLRALGYGAPVRTGFGSTAFREIAPSEKWSRAYDQASFAFGHGLATTLWQHAAALATVVRGGEYRPLTLLRGVSVGGRSEVLPRAQGARVFSEQACAEVREMMRLGAREGTGRNQGREELGTGTKTGTAQKVGTELCSHSEARFRVEHERSPRKEERRALVAGEPAHARSCYTSSMCIFGADPVSGREVMVLVVVEEPTKNGKYGSKVAGDAALAILEEALGLTRGGTEPVATVLGAFAPLEAPESDVAYAVEHPWDGPRGEEQGW
jgi:cell division protein FtsI/penicillin-binding protein 2